MSYGLYNTPYKRFVRVFSFVWNSAILVITVITFLVLIAETVLRRWFPSLSDGISSAMEKLGLIFWVSILIWGSVWIIVGIIGFVLKRTATITNRDGKEA